MPTICLQYIVYHMSTEYCLPYVYRILPTICLQNIAYHLSTEYCLPYVYRILPTICWQNIAYHLSTEYCLLYVYRILPTICRQNIAYHLSTEYCLPYVYRILPTICLQNIAYHSMESCLAIRTIDNYMIWGGPGIIELELGSEDSSTMYFESQGINLIWLDCFNNIETNTCFLEQKRFFRQ